MQGFKSNYDTLKDIALYAEENHKGRATRALLDCGYEEPFDIADDLADAVIVKCVMAIALINSLAEEQDIKFQYLEKNKDGKRWNILEAPQIHSDGDSRPDGNGGWWEVVRQHKPPFQTF